MKKVVLSLAVLFSVAMVACNGNKKAEEAVDSDSIIAATEVVAVDIYPGGDVDIAIPVRDSSRCCKSHKENRIVV